jgi:hypothetical protein
MRPAVWAEACTRAYWKPDTFITAYRASLATSVELVVEASMVGTAVRQLMASHTEWSGTAQELLTRLTAMVGEQAAKQPGWPKRPNTLSNKLRRVTPALLTIRAIGTNWECDNPGSLPGLNECLYRDGHICAPAPQ